MCHLQIDTLDSGKTVLMALSSGIEQSIITCLSVTECSLRNPKNRMIGSSFNVFVMKKAQGTPIPVTLSRATTVYK